ncbi:hypothetical protein [Marinicella litoralis]|uniref:Uncharacterized protein n=1 Tax=Marinicella litoralis TaxID=644220 RepID=A0A4R6XUG3_9GAMM|nr:hypothetical protein [Marinicella litoralis]TDR23456.1 hypothetical protein C8D91_0317 [Marinicella litoralis]
MKKILLILLLILLWVFWPKGNSDHQNTPNVLSKQAADVNKNLKTNTHTKPKNRPKRLNEEPEFVTVQDSMSDKELSYLDIYRMTRLWAQCHQVIYDYQNQPNYDPVARLNLTLSQQHPEQFVQATAPQSKAIQQHANQCIDLLHRLESLNLPHSNITEKQGMDKHNRLKAQLNAYLLAATPKSNKEKAIASVVNLKPEWQQRFQNVLDASKGDETKNAQEIAVIREQLQALRIRRSEINQLIQSTEDQTALKKEYAQTFAEEAVLKETLSSLRLVDPETRTAAIDEFNLVNNQMFNFLNSKDADVFYEAQMTLEQTNRIQYIGHYPYRNIGKGQLKEPFIEYVSPGDVVLQLTGITDVQLFALVINNATQLYLCELGANCGPNSQWIKYHCFDNPALPAAASCDLDLLTFYRDHWMNENQWADVQLLLEIMRGLYEN